jgi:predicted glycosyltransferase
MKLFFYVQHLLGIGHLKRAATLARALADAGFEVTLASGGSPVPGIVSEKVNLVQLPPASAADMTFKTLLDQDGKEVTDEWKTRRREALLRAWRGAGADVLLIELFPFGRRQMRFELLPLIEAARASPRRPLIVSSVRDLIGAGQGDPRRQDEMLEAAERCFDRILVHGDPKMAGFERSFRHAARLAPRLHYTGYVVDDLKIEKNDAGTDEVLVSAGGGAVGQRLLETAILARAQTSLRDRTWRVLAGVNARAADLEALRELAGSGVIVERSRQDFTLRLANCVLSVSQAGYNTVMETLSARARAVLVPFAGGGETEQALRARLLAERGLLEVVEESALRPASLAAAIERVARRPRPAAGAVDLDGAATSARLIRAWLK